jgi:mannosyltransferase
LVLASRSFTENILKYKNRFWLFVAIAIAFLFRVYKLDAQSLWNDEGTSVALASRSLEAIVNGAAQDIHPPLYYFLLHFWIPVAGQTEFAVRFTSVVAGTLAVALTFRIARFFFDVEVANIAAFLSAFSPFQVYYSQETRMYIWLAAFSTLSVYAMIRMLEIKEWSLRSDLRSPVSSLRSPSSSLQSPVSNSRTRRTLFWLLYILSTIAALYSHYFGATLLAVENLSFATWAVLALRQPNVTPAMAGGAGAARSEATTAKRPVGKQSPRTTLPHSVAFWLIAQLLCALAFLPWYLFTRDQLATWPPISEPFDLPTLLWRVLNVFSTGLTLDPSAALLASLAFAFLFFVGWRMTKDPQTVWGVGLMIAWALVPILAMYLVSLSRPAYNPKFLLLGTPPFFILAARGLSTIHPGIFLRPRNPPPRSYLLRYLYFAVSVVAVITFIPSLQNYYYNASYARDDYRAVVRFIDSNARPGDGILIDAPGQIDVVRYYRHGDQPLFPLPRMRPPDSNATRADVDDMLSKTWRLFAIYYANSQSDPQSIVETRLADLAFKARDEWHGNMRLALYGVARNPSGPENSGGLRLGDEIQLESWQLNSQNAHAGDVLALTLNWNALKTPSARYKVFVHLLDANNHIVAQRDGEPVADTRITTTWLAGEHIADNYGLFLEPETPPGDYQIEIGMYRADNGARLPVYATPIKPLGDHWILTTITVQ